MRNNFSFSVPRSEQPRKKVVTSYRRKTFEPLWISSPPKRRNMKLWFLLTIFSWLGVVIYYLWATDHISPDLDILSNNKVKVVVITTFTVISLSICLAMPVFWILTQQNQPDHRLKKKIAELMTTNNKLQQEIPNHLKKKIAELTTKNKKLQQKVEELKREQIEILEDVTEAEPPAKNIPGFNPQEMKALAELAKRLR